MIVPWIPSPNLNGFYANHTEPSGQRSCSVNTQKKVCYRYCDSMRKPFSLNNGRRILNPHCS